MDGLTIGCVCPDMESPLVRVDGCICGGCGRRGEDFGGFICMWCHPIQVPYPLLLPSKALRNSEEQMCQFCGTRGKFRWRLPVEAQP